MLSSYLFNVYTQADIWTIRELNKIEDQGKILEMMLIEVCSVANSICDAIVLGSNPTADFVEF